MNDTGLVEFIEALRENRCLWDPSDASYTNRPVRKTAQTALLNIFKKYDPNANLASVRRKIDNLKSTYQRERKKVETRENTCSMSNEVYVPTLWYYDRLNFLSDAYKVAKSGSESPESIGQPFLDEEEDKQEVRQQQGGVIDVDDFRPPPPKASKRKRNNTNKQLTTIERDSWEAFGSSVGGDLRNLDSKQQAIAQKLISDVIFFAKMGRLSEGSTVADSPIRLVSPSPSASSIMSPTHPACSTHGPLSPFNDSLSNTQQTPISALSKYSLLRDSGQETKRCFSKPQISTNDPIDVPAIQEQPEHATLPQDSQEVMNEQ